MSDKTRLITLGVVVAIFLAGNIVAGYYKWGASRQSPDQIVLTEDTGELMARTNEQTEESQTLPEPAPAEEISSVKDDPEPVNTNIQAQIASLKAENSYLHSIKRTNEDLAASNSNLKEKLQAALRDKQILEKKISELQNDIDQYRNLDAENRRLQAKLEASTGEIEALKARLDKIRVLITGE